MTIHTNICIQAEKKPHAMLTSYPVLQGYINPMLKLAKLLHLRGFQSSSSLSSLKSSYAPNRKIVDSSFCHSRGKCLKQ
jgi:hypothetical protein